MRSSAVTTAIRQSVNEEQSLGINGTPTVAVQNQVGTLDRLRVSGLEPGDFTPALDQALR